MNIINIVIVGAVKIQITVLINILVCQCSIMSKLASSINVIRYITHAIVKYNMLCGT